MLKGTAHRLAGLDLESDGSIVVKGNRSKRRLVNRHQTQGLLAAGRREEFAILNGDVELNSLLVFVVAHVGLQYLDVNVGRRYRTCLFEHLSDLGILVIA